MSLKTSIFYAALLLITSQCSTERNLETQIVYPEPLPDTAALRFLPGIVCSDSLDFNSAFARDGKRFYFSRSYQGKWMIYETSLNNGTWTSPVLAPFSEPGYSQADPFITRDGTLYYISNRPRNAEDTTADYDIWFVRPQAGNTWSQPENVAAVNTDSTEYYVSLSDNGNLYFASNREGGLGDHDIYVSRFVNGVYTTPENLGPSVNSPQMEHDPMVAADESFLIFTSVDRPDTFGSGDLYYTLREDAGRSWTPAKNMGTRFNTATYEYCSYLTPDAKYLFFSSDYDVKWSRIGPGLKDLQD